MASMAIFWRTRESSREDVGHPDATNPLLRQRGASSADEISSSTTIHGDTENSHRKRERKKDREESVVGEMAMASQSSRGNSVVTRSCILNPVQLRHMHRM